MTILKNSSGSLTISDVVNGYYVDQTYLMYTKREAIRRFREYTKTLKNLPRWEMERQGFINYN